MEVLYGTCSENCAGYCKFHSVGITVKQMKQKQCLSKQCRHLEKIESHEYWAQRERAKEKRKNRKEEFKKMIGGYISE